MTGEFIKAFFLIFAAEMGDKTQILAMAFATRYPVKKVLLGIFIGSFLNHGIAVALGAVISTQIPLNTIQIVAGAAFISFALWTLRDENEEEEEAEKIKYGAVITVAIAFFVGELGDKTQLAAITLGASSNFPLMTLVGTVSGMVVTGGLGIIVGKTLGDKIPEIGIKLSASAVFLFFGLTKLYDSVPEQYITINTAGIFLLTLTGIIIFMLYNLYKNKREGKVSQYKKISKELYDYYQQAEKNINSICLGVDNCGICEESKCTVGQIKNLINKGLENNDSIEIDEVLNDTWESKNFDESKIRVSLIMTLNILKDDFSKESLENVHRIRKNLEKMLFGESIESAENWEVYKIKLSKINERSKKFTDNIERK